MTITQRVFTLLAVLAIGSAAAAAIVGRIEWFAYSLIAACVAVIAFGLAKAIQEPSCDEIDAQWATTPFGGVQHAGPPPVESTIVYTPERALTVIRGGQDPAWQPDLEDRRPFWDTDIHGAPE